MKTPDGISDRDLVARSRVGDHAALSSLYTRHRDRLRLLIRYRLGHRLRQRLESEDILQSAFVRAMRRFADAPVAERSFLGWIVTAIDRTLRDRARRHGARKRTGATDEVADLDALPGVVLSAPSEAMRRQEDLAGLQQALDRLSARDRELILLTRIEGRTAGEAGEILGLTAVAAQRATTRALARLAACMPD